MELTKRDRLDASHEAHLAERAEDYIAVLRGDGVIDYHNPRFAGISGYSESDLVSRHIMDFLPPEELGAWRSEMAALRRCPSVDRIFETWIEQPDGTHSEIEVRIAADTYTDGRDFIFCSMRDISLVSAERTRLKAQVADLEQILGGLPGMFWTTELDGRVLQMNWKAAEFFGAEAIQLMEDHSLWLDVVATDEQDGTPSENVAEMTVKIGGVGDERWFKVTRIRFSGTDEAPMSWIYFAQDIHGQQVLAENQLWMDHKLSLIAGAIDGMIWTTDEDGIVDFAIGRMDDGSSAQRLIGHRLPNVRRLPSELSDQEVENEVLAGEPLAFYLNWEGMPSTVEVSPIRNSEGHTLGSFGIVRPCRSSQPTLLKEAA